MIPARMSFSFFLSFYFLYYYYGENGPYSCPTRFGTFTATLNTLYVYVTGDNIDSVLDAL